MLNRYRLFSCCYFARRRPSTATCLCVARLYKRGLIGEFWWGLSTATIQSAFCPVVATGLSGCFSQLGRIFTGDGAERIVPDHAVDSLANFHSSLLFCNAVVQVSSEFPFKNTLWREGSCSFQAAHPAVVEQICSYFYSGFLISVVKPALLQVPCRSLRQFAQHSALMRFSYCRDFRKRSRASPRPPCICSCASRRSPRRRYYGPSSECCSSRGTMNVDC